MAGIPLGGSNFTRGAAIPLDDTFTAADSTARDAIVPGVRYPGMLCYVVADQVMYQLIGGITNGDWTVVGGGGSGGGGGAQNLITDGDAEQGITNYTEGEYGLTAKPVGFFAASSGAGAFTISTTTTNPINGATSFLLTKSAGASRQGRAIIRDIAIDREYQTKVMQMKIKYSVLSGSFIAGHSGLDGSMIFYIAQYNGSTWSFTEPSSYKCLSNSSFVDYVNGTFQVNHDTTQLRLICYLGDDTDSAWTMQCEFEISPSVYVYGAPITDWQSYTPTFTSFGTVTGTSFFWRRVGGSVDIRGVFTTGTTIATEARISLPNGLTSASNLPALSKAGDMGSAAADAASWQVNIEPSINYLTMGKQSAGAAGFIKGNGNGFNSSTAYSLIASVPILGWSSSVQMSDSADTRIVDFVGTVTSGTALTANVTDIPLTAEKDSHDAWSGTVFTVLVPGDYLVNAGMQFTIPASTSIIAYVNGSASARVGTAYNSTVLSGSTAMLPNLKAGDTISFRSQVSLTTVAATSEKIWIQRISGPSAIAASEKISASYYMSSSASTSTALPIQYNEKLWDTHGCVTTGSAWKFTSKTARRYKITTLTLSSGAGGGWIGIYKNGVLFQRLVYNADLQSNPESASASIYLLADEYFDIRAISTFTALGGALSSGVCTITVDAE